MRVGFSRFLDARNVIFSDFGGPGPSLIALSVILEARRLVLESLESIVRISGIVVIFRMFQPRFTHPILR